MIQSSTEYALISAVYGDTRAKRSKVLYMDHINEGLLIMQARNVCLEAQKAFCLHPIIQEDELLKQHYWLVELCNPMAVGFAYEYRHVANNSLLTNYTLPIQLSPLPEVNEMLVADKVQNFTDFMLYHSETHPKSMELHKYFTSWLVALDISMKEFGRLSDLILD